jgi:hypothetical protein
MFSIPFCCADVLNKYYSDNHKLLQLEYVEKKGKFSASWPSELCSTLNAAAQPQNKCTIRNISQYLAGFLRITEQVTAASWQPTAQINTVLQQHYEAAGSKPTKAQLWSAAAVVPGCACFEPE